jgi:hypothetical protein
LQTLFKRESAAESILQKNQMNIPSSVPKLIVAHPLFRYEDPNQAGWKAGSNGIVGLHKKWRCVKTKKKALSEETKRGLLVPGAKKI